MNTPADRREQFAKYAAGLATAVEIQRLNEAILQDASLRREFVEFMHLDAALEDWAAGAIEVRPLKLAADRRRTIAYAAMATAAALLMGLLLQRSWPSVDDTTERSRPPDAAAMTQATIVLAQECRWEGTSYREGQRVPAGVIRLLSGNAVIRLDGGTLLMLNGDCDLELRSDGAINMRRGVVTARSADEADGFVVHVPSATVVDLGTEFVLRVDGQGNTEVHVVEGSVRVEHADAAEAAPILLAEHAVRIQQEHNADLEPIAYNGEPISEMVKRLREDLPSQLRAQESFEYPLGAYEPKLLSGGLGWDGAWRLPVERDGSPAYPGTQRLISIAPGATGESFWKSPAGKSFRVRSLSEPIDLASNGVLYIGLTIYAEETVASSGPFAEQARSVRLSFRAAPPSPSESFALGFNKSLRPIVETSAGRSFVGRTKLPNSKSVRLVGKLLSRTVGEDELSLIFLDTQDLSERLEPEAWDVSTRGVQLSGSLRDVLVTSHGPAARGLDDLRVGSTWWSVVQQRTLP
ncbi:MAG: hypothetical protein C0483_04840 [Pirellula sp.]|nr:hypothetical protein [Pirellula sp.]